MTQGVTSTLMIILVLIGVSLAIFASPIAIVPIVLLMLALVGLPLIGRFIAERGDTGSAEPDGVPTTSQASYDPVDRPGSVGRG
jgi:hypothetical protein